MVRLDGLTQEDCRLLADRLLAGAPVKLGGGSVRAAWQWSGGNPALLLSIMGRCYDLKQSGAARPDWMRDVVVPVLRENQRLLSHWCRYLDEAELSAMLDEVLLPDHRDHPVTSALGFSAESVNELRQKNAYMCEMLDSAIRISRMVRLFDGEPPAESYDYSIYVNVFFRPLEKQVLDCVFPLMEAWPVLSDIQGVLDGGSSWRLEKDRVSVAQYERFLRGAASNLAKLCRQAGIGDLSEARSWTALPNDVRTARLIRNGSTHPEALQKLSAGYHSETGVTRKAAKAFLRAAYIDHRLFHTLSVCPDIAAYLRRKPNALR